MCFSFWILIQKQPKVQHLNTHSYLLLVPFSPPLVEKGNEIRRCRGWRLHAPIISMAALAALGPGRLRRHADAACRLRLVPGALGRLSLQARYGTELQMDGPWGRWFERQRLHAHAPEVAPCTTCPFLGTLFESLVSWHSQIVIWEGHEGSCVRCHVDLFESS